MYTESEDKSSKPSEETFSLFDEEVFTRQYTVLKNLSEGGNNELRLSLHRLTGTQVVVKALMKSERGAARALRLSEVEIMKVLNHPNIVSLVQVMETKQNIYLIMEEAQGKLLFHRVQEAGYLKEDEARSIFIQLLSAICYCHDNGIIHRDLKPDKIIVDERGQVKIIDFGLGARFLPGQKLKRLCGGLHFIPPEIFLGRPYDGPKVDMWALGVLLYFMVTGLAPFKATTFSELSKKVLQGRYYIPYYLSKDVRSIIGMLLTVNARQRPSAQDLLSHPWLQGEKTLTFPSNGDTSSPDRDIMVAMEKIGFCLKDTIESLKCKKFDETMATYLLLRGQASQNDASGVQRKIMKPGAAPIPSRADPDIFPLPLKRRASEPSLHSVRSPEQHYLRQRGESDAPALPKKSALKGSGYKRSMTAPCLSFQRDTTVNVATTSCSTGSPAEKILHDPERGGTSSSPQPRGWAKWKKRIGACFRSLCCCCVSPHRKVRPQ